MAHKITGIHRHEKFLQEFGENFSEQSCFGRNSIERLLVPIEPRPSTGIDHWNLQMRSREDSAKLHNCAIEIKFVSEFTSSEPTPGELDYFYRLMTSSSDKRLRFGLPAGSSKCATNPIQQLEFFEES